MQHLTATGWGLRRVLDAASLEAIEQAIAETERVHGGEIRFAIEANLGAADLMKGVTPRDRALQMFAELSVWDTEANNGVLIYVLWADHDVEIVADRGFNGLLTPLFGGFAATGAIARTATNIRNGATSPLAGVVHSLFLAGGARKLGPVVILFR